MKVQRFFHCAPSADAMQPSVLSSGIQAAIKKNCVLSGCCMNSLLQDTLKSDLVVTKSLSMMFVPERIA